LCLFLAARLLKTAHNRQSSQQVTRCFPPPWSVEEQAACFVVRDHNGQQLAYVYFEDEPGGDRCRGYFPGVPVPF